MSLLEVEGLETEIELRHAVVRAVDGVSFAIEPGEIVGLVGESGSGKSMTGHSIMQLLPPGGRIVGGAVRLDERDLTGLNDRQLQAVRGNDIGMVFQDPMTALNPSMTIGRQITEAVKLHHPEQSKRDHTERALEVLGLVGMPQPRQRMDEYPHRLSGGLRQRVLIAIALACEPRLLIADEPTTALDVTIQAQILDLIDSLTERLELGVLLITHDMGVIAGRTDRTLVMYAGQIVEQSATAELFVGPRHRYTEALLGSVPTIDMNPNERLRTIAGLPPSLTEPLTGCRFAPRCSAATDVCRAEVPPLSVDDDNHRYACFHPPDRDGAASTAGAAARTPATVRTPDPVPGPDEQPPRYLVRLEHVSQEFKVTAGIFQRSVGTLKAVTDLTLDVEAGETFGLVGESGCGKTTVGRMITGLQRPSAGRVLFDDTDIATLRARALRPLRAEMQLMFQDPYASLNPRMRAGDIIRDPLRVQRRGSGREQLDRVSELLDEVGLDATAADRYPHEFSGGQRQRIGLARALALQPRLIVADEPVSALDASIRSQVLNLMKRLQASHGLTYLMISHDMAVVRYMATRVGVMYLGRLVELGSADDVFAHTAHPYTAALLRAVPTPDPSVERAKRGGAISGELPSAMSPPSGCVFRTRCPLVQDRCAEEVPVLGPADAGHRVACHFPLETVASGMSQMTPPATVTGGP